MQGFSRLDISVYNEATGFLITSKGLAGYKFDDEPSSSQWQQLVHEGVFLPVSLIGDNGPTFRVILNDTLTEQEKEECVDHFSAKLHVLDGKLALIGGCEYIWGEDCEEYMEVLDVPPGQYRVDVYTCFTGINGPDLYWGNYEVDAGQPGATNAKDSGGPLESEPVGAWFRRTRPQEDFPQWLIEHCYEDPRSDPGHEQFWYDYEDVYQDDDHSPGFVDFIIQLRPIDTVPPPSDIVPFLEEDWIPTELNLQLPSECPRGLPADRLVKREE